MPKLKREHIYERCFFFFEPFWVGLEVSRKCPKGL
jgi:hypothetical protein